MITRSLYKTVRLGEVYCDEPLGNERVDIVRFNQALNPIPHSSYVEFYTRLIDLTLPEESIFTSIKKDTRTEIRRAAREEAAFQIWRYPDRETLEQFVCAYDSFARQRELPIANQSRLNACVRLERLVLSRAHVAGCSIVWHAYYCTETRARLLHSAQSSAPTQPSRSVAGRLNRFLHWNDIRFFRNTGFQLYDLGGWYPGVDDRKKLAINTFKAEFGGVIAREYNCLLGMSAFGRMLCSLHGWTHRGAHAPQMAL